jgi:hypothetical protein
MNDNDIKIRYEFKYSMYSDEAKEDVRVILNYGADENVVRLVNEFAMFLRKCGYAEGTVQKFINEEF